MSRMMGGGLSPSRPSGVKEEGAEHPGADAAQAGAAVQGGEEAAGARKRTQQERSPARAGMASSKLRKADDVTRAGGSPGEEEEGEGEAAEGRQLFFQDREGDWSGTGGGSRTPPPSGALAADSSAASIEATRDLRQEGQSSPTVARATVQDSSGGLEEEQSRRPRRVSAATRRLACVSAQQAKLGVVRA